MMASIARMVAVLLVATTATFANAAAAQDAEAPRAGVYQVDPAAAADPGVRIVRGSDVRRPYDGDTRVRPAKIVPGAEAVGGDTLWLIDRKADRLTGCTLAPSLRRARAQIIRCSTRRLP